MKSFRYFSLLGLLISLHIQPVALAQPIGEWASYTSQTTVSSLAVDDEGTIWAATENGVFFIQDGDMAGSLATTEGLYRINPAAMLFDKENQQIWFGYNDGTFESYDPETRRFRRYSDIARATRFSPRGINAFALYQGDLVIATDFGIVVFDPRIEATKDTYSNLGSFSSGSSVSDMLIDGSTIYAVTGEGLASANMESGDLIVPDFWSNHLLPGSGPGVLSGLTLRQGALIALVDNRLYTFNEGRWERMDLFGDQALSGLASSEDGAILAAWGSHRTYISYPDGSTANYDIPSHMRPVNDLLPDIGRGELILATTQQGVYIQDLFTGEEQHHIIPDGPNLNRFSGLNVQDGVLISASSNLYGRRGVGTSQSGYYLHRDETWHNFNDSTDPLLQETGFNSAYTTAVSPDYYFIGSWGRGIVQHNAHTDEVTHWDTSNSLLDGHQPGSSYIVASGLAVDRNRHLWVVSRQNTVNPLFRFVSDSQEWTRIPKFPNLTGIEFYEQVMADSYNQLWLTVFNERNDGRGLVVKKVEGSTIIGGILLTESATQGNLPHNEVTALVEDRRGEVWIGTRRGLARFTFPGRVIDGTSGDRQASLIINADTEADAPFLLRTSYVTDIVVNSANQKWVGTNGEGLWLIDEEGGRHRVIRHFTTDNSPLLSNTINSLAYDEETGNIFIATDLGLISYTDVVRGSVDKMSDLFIYPNPFSYQNETQERVVIDRLSEQTVIRILTIDGRLVRQLQTRGGRAEWDVRNYQGSRVATGVYIVVAVDDQNDQKGVGKIAVIR